MEEEQPNAREPNCKRSYSFVQYPKEARILPGLRAAFLLFSILQLLTNEARPPALLDARQLLVGVVAPSEARHRAEAVQLLPVRSGDRCGTIANRGYARVLRQVVHCVGANGLGANGRELLAVQSIDATDVGR